jgi:hypothetical protein
MTIFDWLEQLAFLRGEPAALLAVATAVAIFILPDARLGLFALAANTFAAALLFVDVLDPRLAVVKLLIGWFVCLILYLTGRQVNWGRPPVDLTPEEAAAWQPQTRLTVGRYQLPHIAIRGVLAALALTAVWLLSRRASLSLPLLPESLDHFRLAVYALVGFGLLQMSANARPLTAGLGAFLFLSGFELYYSYLDQNVVGLGLLAAINLTVALAIAYLAQARYALPLPEPGGRRIGERLTAVIGLLALGFLGLRLAAWQTIIPESWAAIRLLLLTLAAFYALSLVRPPGGGATPLTLAALLALSFVLLLPPVWGAPLLIIGLLLLAMAAQGGQRGDVGAAWRYLVLLLLALPFLLLAGWQAGLPSAVAPLLIGAAVLLLGGFPAYLWVRPVAVRASPLLLPLLFGGAQFVIFAYFFDWLAGQPGWAADATLRGWLTWSGVGTALVGGWLAVSPGGRRKLLASLLLVDMGATLLLLSGGAGWETAVSHYQSRALALLLAGAGCLLWQDGAKGWKRPLGQLLWLYGALALLGLPLTPGFAARWSLLTTLDPAPAGLLLLAMLGGVWGLVRALLRRAERT